MFDLKLEKAPQAPEFQLLESVVVSVHPQRVQGMFYWFGKWQYWLSGAKIYFPETMLKGNQYRKIFRPCKVNLPFEFGSWVKWCDSEYKIIGARYRYDDWYFVLKLDEFNWCYADKPSISSIIE